MGEARRSRGGGREGVIFVFYAKISQKNRNYPPSPLFFMVFFAILCRIANGVEGVTLWPFVRLLW